MFEYTLPKDIKGQWIWLHNSEKRKEEFAFFRKEFSLYETPASAELWIAARTLFHLYINGRYLGFGAVPCVSDDADVAYFDISFLLETGANTIAVIAYNTDVSRTGSRRKRSGLWLQVNIDEKPFLWTDNHWKCREGNCYASNMPRISHARGFCEKNDLRHFPVGWAEPEYQPVDWREPDDLFSLDEARGELLLTHRADWELKTAEAIQKSWRGTYRQTQAVTNIIWGKIARETGEGVYAAESFVYSKHDVELEIQLFADDPYVLFVGESEVKRQGIKPLPPRADLMRCKPVCFAQDGVESPEGVLPLKAGWNRLLFVQEVEADSSGATIVFPDLAPEEVALIRKPGQDKLVGWSLMGPLKIPIQYAEAQLHLVDVHRCPYVPFLRPCADESAFLVACRFTKKRSVEPGAGSEDISLGLNEYVVFDFGHTFYGCPTFEVSGEDGDIVDIVCSEQVASDQALPWTEGRRNVDVLVLGSGAGVSWTGYAPRGFRYMMIAVRRTSFRISIKKCGIRYRKYRFENPGLFKSADSLLNQIWEVGCNTLSATLQGRFIDAPSKDTTQYVTDAMIQALAAYHICGGFDIAGLGLEEFAQTQFENGAISATCPGDFFVEMPDYALMWPVWLEQHYLYSGDKKLLERSIPILELLLARYRRLGDADGVLVDLHLKSAGFCFLDHGDIHREGMVTGLNAIYCRALLSAANLFQQIGLAKRGDSLRSRASHIAHVVRQHTWDADAGLFADCWVDGDISDFTSWQTNVLAIYGGIAKVDEYDGILAKIFAEEAPFEPLANPDSNNPFFQYFVLENAFSLGLREWAVDLMRWYWGGMIKRGANTWWEMFDPRSNPDEVPTFSLCSGYGLSPSLFLCSEVAGISPAEPGSTRVYFNPLPEVVPWVEARIPTPHGHISVEWKLDDNEQLEVAIDANYDLEVIPILSPKVAETATFHVGKSIVILAEDEE